MIRKKNSAKQLSKEKYSQLSTEEKSKKNRFVLCLNKLCNHINKKPAAATKVEETINLVSSYEYIITADLQDSFNQRKIVDSKLPYMGFHSPFGDNYILLRSPQGLLNQSEELEMLVKVVLKEGVQAGYVRVHADNIYVMGHTQAEAIDRWERVLKALEDNNLKLSPKKTACFPNKLDLLGWIKEGKFLIPDPHRQNTLLTCTKPENIKQLRSFLGSYHTFYKCQKKHNMLLSPLTKLLSQNPPPSQKIHWTPELDEVFTKAQSAAKSLDKLYTPKPSDQLAITSDYAEKGTNMEAGISATLWALVQTNWLVVARMSAEIQPQQKNLHPCDGEATASYVAGKTSTFSVPIKASLKKTLSLVDSKPLVEAAKLLNRGKFSTSKLINNVLSSISDLNLDFQHISGKLSKNCPDDFGSRFPTACPDPNSCKLHSFIRECTSFTVSRVELTVSLEQEGAIIGQIQRQDDSVIRDILTGKATLPLNNKRAFAYLQSRDQDLLRVRELLLAGQRPSEKRGFKPVKHFFRSDIHTTIDRTGCIMVVKRNRQTLVTRELVVVPDSMSMGLLYSLHLNLNHPSNDQLHKAVDTRFFITDLANKCKSITEDCTPCSSIKSIPTEVYEYKQNVVPDHPGKAFTVDVMKECKKIVVVAADNFSGFIATVFANTEKEVDLRDAIIRAVCPFMASSLSRIRVDRAPGFAKLSTKAATLAEIGIDMELGECKNKDALAIVDKKIQELRSAIKKISPSHTVLNQMTLSKATTVVNESIRHHKLSAKEIQFSRDLTSTTNLQLDDEVIKAKIEEHRTLNNPYSAKSKSTFQKPASRAEASQGQLVFLKNEGSKNRRRDLYIVIAVDQSSDILTICKIRNVISNKSASMVPHDPRYRYNVSQTDIFLAPNQPPPPINHEAFYMAEETEAVTNLPEVRNKQDLQTDEEDTEDDDIVWFQNNEPAGQTQPAEQIGQIMTTAPLLDISVEVNPLEEEELEENVDELPEDEQYWDQAHVIGHSDDQLEDQGEGADDEEDDDDSDDDELLVQLNQDIVHLVRPKFPTKGKFIKFKRQNASRIAQDFYIPANKYSYAQITDKLKPDKFGRVYFNIRYPNNTTDGIYLARGDITTNDFIWDIIEEEEFLQQGELAQIDGAIITPHSLTPDSSPQHPHLQIIPCSSPDWDHSPERLTEDNAFLWEDEPLRALTASDLLEANGDLAEKEDHNDSIKSPLGTFRRQPAIRRKKTQCSGFASNLIPHPSHTHTVHLKKANNLYSLLTPHRPVLPELVDLDKSQELDLALEMIPGAERLIN